MRLLQVLATTDADDDALGALVLHDALAAAGAEVRTVALGPGRRGGLDAEVPVLAPSPRSAAARYQLRRERGWADVVVAVGAATAAVLDRSEPPVVVVPGAELDRWRVRPPASRLRRRLDRAALMVVADPTDVGFVGRELSAAPPVAVLPAAVPEGPVVSPAARAAARELLGLDADAVVARVVGEPARADAGVTAAVDAASSAGVALLGADPADRLGERAEWAAAAADIAVSALAPLGGPPRGLLLAARDGLALVAPARGATAGLVDGTTGVPAGPEVASLAGALAVLAGDPDRRAGCGAAAAARVAERYSVAVRAGEWQRLLEGLAGRERHGEN
ncbi:MAG: hypothetical protein ACOYOP_04745 [Microthrixaceae bacterium]